MDEVAGTGGHYSRSCFIKNVGYKGKAGRFSHYQQGSNFHLHISSLDKVHNARLGAIKERMRKKLEKKQNMDLFNQAVINLNLYSIAMRRIY